MLACPIHTHPVSCRCPNVPHGIPKVPRRHYKRSPRQQQQRRRARAACAAQQAPQPQLHFTEAQLGSFDALRRGMRGYAKTAVAASLVAVAQVATRSVLAQSLEVRLSPGQNLHGVASVADGG